MERTNIMSFGVVLLKFLMRPLFTIACVRKKVHVGSRGDQGAYVLDGVRLHSSCSTWCGTGSFQCWLALECRVKNVSSLAGVACNFGRL